MEENKECQVRVLVPLKANFSPCLTVGVGAPLEFAIEQLLLHDMLN